MPVFGCIVDTTRHKLIRTVEIGGNTPILVSQHILDTKDIQYTGIGNFLCLIGCIVVDNVIKTVIVTVGFILQMQRFYIPVERQLTGTHSFSIQFTTSRIQRKIVGTVEERCVYERL